MKSFRKIQDKILSLQEQTASLKRSKKWPQTFSLEMVSVARRSDAERSCLNTGDGCNRILSLNDGQRGEHAITSSQPVHQSEREEEKKRKQVQWRKRRHIHSLREEAAWSESVTVLYLVTVSSVKHTEHMLNIRHEVTQFTCWSWTRKLTWKITWTVWIWTC